MPPVMQAKLLRVLEEKEIERVGGGRPIAVDVRVLVATHRDLPDLVKQGQFREDLFHRVYVFPLALPPLRERPEDIPVLAAHFSRRVAEQNHWKPKVFTDDAVAALAKYSWPGNARELFIRLDLERRGDHDAPVRRRSRRRAGQRPHLISSGAARKPRRPAAARRADRTAPCSASGVRAPR